MAGFDMTMFDGEPEVEKYNHTKKFIGFGKWLHTCIIEVPDDINIIDFAVTIDMKKIAQEVGYDENSYGFFNGFVKVNFNNDVIELTWESFTTAD